MVDSVEFERVVHFIAVFGLDEDEVDHILDRFADINSETLKALGAEKLRGPRVHLEPTLTVRRSSGSPIVGEADNAGRNR